MKSIIVLIKVLTKSIGRNQVNNSRIMENIVYFELLRRGYEVTIGCVGNYEIDFVCKKMGEKIYVQLTRELTHEDTIERECRPLLMVKDNYPKISYQQMSLTCLGTE